MSDTIKCRNNFDEIVELPREKFVFRPSVYAISVNDGKILLMDSKSVNKFWFPGGGVEIGEKLNDALERECLEETGLEIKTIGELLLFRENFFYYQPTDEAMQAFAFFFLCEFKSNKIESGFLADDGESKDPRWVEIKEISKEDFTKNNEEIYHQIIEKLK